MEVLGCCPMNRRGILADPAWELRKGTAEEAQTAVIQMALWQRRRMLEHGEAIGVRRLTFLRLRVPGTCLPKANL